MERETVIALIEMKENLQEAQTELGANPFYGSPVGARVYGRIERAVALIESILAKGR